MAGRGKVERLGDVLDVLLNVRAFWRDVPIEVWEYRFGGYQVLKMWLSYRESKVLGRGLEVGEVGWFSAVARRLAGIASRSEIHSKCSCGWVNLAVITFLVSGLQSFLHNHSRS